MLANVNSSATMALQPEVPNLITELIGRSPGRLRGQQNLRIRCEPQGTYCNTGMKWASSSFA
jgi:hypothetical protein